MTCCTGNCNQGRACPNAPDPSRAAIFLPLHRLDGGMHVDGRFSFPIPARKTEQDDAPLYTPESAAEPLPGIAQALVGFIVLILLAASAFALPALISH